MTNRLKQYFPMLRTRTEIMEIILKDKTLKTLFDSWETEFQEEFLKICKEMFQNMHPTSVEG